MEGEIRITEGKTVELVAEMRRCVTWIIGSSVPSPIDYKDSWTSIADPSENAWCVCCCVCLRQSRQQFPQFGVETWCQHSRQNSQVFKTFRYRSSPTR